MASELTDRERRQRYEELKKMWQGSPSLQEWRELAARPHKASIIHFWCEDCEGLEGTADAIPAWRMINEHYCETGHTIRHIDQGA